MVIPTTCELRDFRSRYLLLHSCCGRNSYLITANYINLLIAERGVCLYFSKSEFAAEQRVRIQASDFLG